MKRQDSREEKVFMSRVWESNCIFRGVDIACIFSCVSCSVYDVVYSLTEYCLAESKAAGKIDPLYLYLEDASGPLYSWLTSCENERVSQSESKEATDVSCVLCFVSGRLMKNQRITSWKSWKRSIKKKKKKESKDDPSVLQSFSL